MGGTQVPIGLHPGERGQPTLSSRPVTSGTGVLGTAPGSVKRTEQG